ncbi:ubiquitin carboxyl-terminal hydrolase 17 isoform X3 [Lolium perenne]|uniref:ubiquitin carboxyl-terminal hydrolase 17 isoform X3 n=1 Tax=Lolium perenne TaxID=4522 RepID=UPI0021F65E52|nr:ubiquitin carboxyl-terminal hydrolase 17-like isoform X3 [Lolium perenne]
MASFVAALVAVAVVALATAAWRWLQCEGDRRDELEEASRLAWLASEELQYAEPEPYDYANHGPFWRAADMADAPLWTAPEAPAPPRVQVQEQQHQEAAATDPLVPDPTVPAATGKKGSCAVCRRQTSFRCKRCKGVNYCTFKCQIVHWRQGHKDECHPQSVDARKDGTVKASSAEKGVECNSSNEESVVEGVEPAVKTKSSIAVMPESSKENCVAKCLNDESKEMPFGKASNTVEASEHDNNMFTFCSVTEHTESADCSSFPTSGEACKVKGASVSENGSPSHIPADNSSLQADRSAGLESEMEQSSAQAPCIDNLKSSRSLPSLPTIEKASSSHAGAHFAAGNPSKKADNLIETSVRSESSVMVPNNLSMAKSLITQQTAPIFVSTSESYELFVKLYNFEKVELHPFGLCNLGNSCYANVVIQCLTFTRPLTAYLLEGLHSKNCSNKVWCFLCEFERLIMEGKRGQSPLSPTGILSHLSEIGSSFGPGEQEDAHEFLRYAIDTMQSAIMNEANTDGGHELSEEATLMQLMFGGYLRSKIKCTKCKASSEQRERIMDLTVEIDGAISTLEDALHRFTSKEILDGDNKYHCIRCNSYERAKKKLTISEAPNILTIALKRYQSGMFGKINKAIRFPEYLNLSSYMSTTHDCSPVYGLYAVVVHRDINNASFSGHYVCYVKDSHGKWHEMDDSQVKPVSLEEVHLKCAYMLLYARCSPRAPSSLRKVVVQQDPSRRKKASQTVDPEPTSLEGGSYLSRHQESTSPSGSSSIFSNSDAGSTGTLGSDSTDSTRNSGSMEDYDFIFGSSDQINLVSSVLIPEEHELSYSRRSSLNPSSSTEYADQGEVERLQQLNHKASRGVWNEGGENLSVFYPDQGKYPGSLSISSRSSGSSNSICKLTEQGSSRMTAEVDHGWGYCR